jgi:hypothetical protein
MVAYTMLDFIRERGEQKIYLHIFIHIFDLFDAGRQLYFEAI